MRDRWAGKKPRAAAGFIGARNKVWCQVWWRTPEIPALGKWRQKNGKSQVSLGYIITSSPKKKKKMSSLTTDLGAVGYQGRGPNLS